MRSKAKSLCCVFLVVVSLLSLSSCKGEGIGLSGGEEAFDYAVALAAYSEGALNVQTTLTCALPTPIELSYILAKTDDGGYAASATAGGNTFTCAAGEDTAQIFKQSCYLPPYDTALERSGDGVYTARLDTEDIRELVLSGSKLFDSYTANEGVTLIDGCVYTVYAEGGRISSYSYAFGLSVKDGSDSFSAEVKYLVEVKK